MKIIPVNTITALTADSQTANFPYSHLENIYAGRIWKAVAGDNEATITTTVNKATDITVFNTNAISATLTVAGQDPITLTQDTYTRAFWFPVATPFYTSTQATILLTAAPGETLHGGIVWAGIAQEYRGLKYGLAESQIDNSISIQLTFGGHYYEKKPIQRSFDLSFLMERDSDFFDFMYGIFRQYGSKNMPFKLSDHHDNWNVFGRCVLPEGSHDYPKHSPLNMSIIEDVHHE